METSTRSCNNFYLSQMLPSPSAIRKSLSFFDKYPTSFPGIILHGSSGTLSTDPAPLSIPNPGESWFADYGDWLFDEGGNAELPFVGGGKSSDSRVVPDSFCPGGNEFSGNPFGANSTDPAPFPIPNPVESRFADCYDWLFDEGGNRELPFGGGGKSSDSRVVPDSFCPGGNGFFGNGGNGKLPFGGDGEEEAREWRNLRWWLEDDAEKERHREKQKREREQKEREKKERKDWWKQRRYAKKKMEEEADSGILLDPSVLFKFVTGAAISSYCAMIRELHKRGKGFLADFRQYALGLLFGMVSNVSLMLAPYVRYCHPFASIGNLGGLQHPSTALPSSESGAGYGRISDLLEFLREFKEAWYACKSAVKLIARFRHSKGVILAFACCTIIVAANVPPNVMSAAFLVAVFSVAINHIIDGLKEASPTVEKVTPAAIPPALGANRFPSVAVTFRAGAQFANDAYDAMQYGYSGLHGVRRMNAQSFLYMYLSLTTTIN